MFLGPRARRMRAVTFSVFQSRTREAEYPPNIFPTSLNASTRQTPAGAVGQKWHRLGSGQGECPPSRRRVAGGECPTRGSPIHPHSTRQPPVTQPLRERVIPAIYGEDNENCSMNGRAWPTGEHQAGL